MTRVLWIIFLLFPGVITGQPTVKRALTADDYAGWKTISGQKISAGGALVLFEVNPQKGDGELHVYDIASGKTHIVKRGKNAEADAAGRFVVFRISPPEDSLRKAKVKMVKKEEMPLDSLGILFTPSGKVEKFPGLKSFSFTEEDASWIAFTLEPKSVQDTSGNTPKGKPSKKQGDDLILYRISSGDTLHFRNVTEFTCPKKGNPVLFAQERKDSANTFSSINIMDPESGKKRELFTAPGFVKKLGADEQGRQYAFLHSGDTARVKSYALYYGLTASPAPREVAGSGTPGMVAGWRPSENGNIAFSEDGGKLWLATAPTPVEPPKDTIPDDEKAKVDLLSWHDADLMSQQLKDLEKEKKRSYSAVWLTGEERFVQLGDTLLPVVTPAGRGRDDVALGVNDHSYRRVRSWDREEMADYYLVNVNSGERRLLAEGNERARLSPGGLYLYWFEKSDSSYHILSTQMESPTPRSLTRNIPVAFHNELNDTPGFPGAYGIAGWSDNDKAVFVYDRYDIWKVDPEGGEDPVCVTGGFGRQNNITLRYLKTDPEEEYIPGGQRSLLRGFHTETMASGFYDADLHIPGTPRLLMTGPWHLGNPLKAKNSDRVVWSRESATEFPDLWTSDLTFKKPVKISHANPQQREFNWLTAELTEWTSFTGEKLKGMLYKPENFDPSRKYPMVVYFYERSADNLHRYVVPSPSRSTINRALYASNGYLVFVPDITYRTGFPGQSAYDAIVSGVYALAATRPYVDLTKVGLQGQSWGGYQTAWLITRTPLFAAAMAGAPVSNMTSAYGGIRWESGMSRMAQYEQSQSRIGASLWEKPMHYIDNSPLFGVPSITTPLLMMHNDNDGAVPWSQGIEMFMALTRLSKPVWLLNYNGEPHNLKGESWANRMDLDKRMFQFFNHYLKEEPMPQWMEKGIPAIEKGKDNGN